MKNADVTITDLYGNYRVTLNSQIAIDAGNNEPEIAGYVLRRDGMTYLDIKKSRENKKNMLMFCREYKLTVKMEN